MARWQYTIQDPHSPSIDAVTLDCFTANQRSIARLRTFNRFTFNNTPVISGPRGDYRLVWNIAAQLTEATAARLSAMFLKCNSRWDNAQDGHLVLTDEFEYTIPALTSSSKSLLAGSSENLTYGGQTYVRGFPQVKVKIDLPDNFWEHLGAISGEPFKQVTFTATEIGNVS